MGINFSILVKSAGIYHPGSTSGDDDKNYQAMLTQQGWVMMMDLGDAGGDDWSLLLIGQSSNTNSQ